MRKIYLPNGEQIDFAHLFATMDGIVYSDLVNNYVHLTGWGGDAATLINDIKNKTGNLEQLMAEAKKIFGKGGYFDGADLITDLDASILLNKKTDQNYFSDIIKEYYSGKEYLNRIDNLKK